MTLQNGYKVLYDTTAGSTRTFYASKTGLFKDADIIAEATIGEYKLVYEKDGNFYGSTTGIPAEGDHCFEEFRAVFEEGYSTEVEEDESEELPKNDTEDESNDIKVEDETEE